MGYAKRSTELNLFDREKPFSSLAKTVLSNRENRPYITIKVLSTNLVNIDCM